MSDVRWGFLGAGWLATQATAAAVHAASGAVLEVVAARDIARATALEPRRAYDSYRAVVEDADVDAIYISLANDAHLPWILAAVDAGKHVLCEKPLVLSAEDARRAYAAADAAGVLLVEAVWSRWHPRVRRIVDLAVRGELGELTGFLGTFTFRLEARDNYRFSAAAGGGALYDVGIYPLHVLLACLPQDSSLEVAAVECERDGRDIDLTTKATVTWTTGRGSVVASFDMPESQRLVIDGTEGGVRIYDDQAFTSWREPTRLNVTDRSGGNRVEVFAAVDAYEVMFEQVSARIRGEDVWVVPSAMSIRVAELVDEVRRRSA